MAGKDAKFSGYKGRPLNGIWATAPYLHNGSVPNLYEILLPQSERSKTFTLGSRQYDPVPVGSSLTQPEKTASYTPFVFDTTIPGNLNRGHELGTCVPYVGENCAKEKISFEQKNCKPLTKEQRWEFVEHMKTL